MLGRKNQCQTLRMLRKTLQVLSMLIRPWQVFIVHWTFPLIVSTYPAGQKRARCGECAGCTASSCKICKYCRDSPKFGGPGKLKKACIQRVCTNMQPPSSKIKQMSQPVKSSKMKFILSCYGANAWFHTAIKSEIVKYSSMDVMKVCLLFDTTSNIM